MPEAANLVLSGLQLVAFLTVGAMFRHDEALFAWKPAKGERRAWCSAAVIKSLRTSPNPCAVSLVCLIALEALIFSVNERKDLHLAEVELSPSLTLDLAP